MAENKSSKKPAAKKTTKSKVSLKPIAKKQVSVKKAVQKTAPKTIKKTVKKAAMPVKAAARNPSAKASKSLKKIPMAKPLAAATPVPRLPTFKGQKKKLYDMLMEARRQFEKQINFHSSEALTAPGSSGELSNSMSNHMADFGSDNFLHEMELEMMSSEIEVLEMIDEAVERLVSGDFGKCLDCGCQIAMERLEAKPYARFCIKCKSAREENNGLRPEFNR
ncbi:MAG: TraR/DksA C4-type zinc finger protein [Victivallales bacterium]